MLSSVHSLRMVSLASISDVLNVWKYDHNALDIASTFTPPTGRSCCLAWNHTNQVVATGGISHQIHLIQASNGNILSSLQVSDSQSEAIQTNAVAFAGNSRLLAAALGSNIQLWDLKKRQMKTMMSDHQTRVSALCFLPAGELISGDTFGAIRIWDAKAYKSSPELIMPSATAQSVVASITSLSISPSGGKSLAAGYTDGVLGVWDSASCTLLRKQLCHTGKLTALAYSPRNAKLVTTGGSDGRVTLIDTSSRNSKDPSAVIEVPGGGGVTSVSFHEDAIHTAVGLSNGKILVYDWRNLRKPVASTPVREAHPILALAFQVPKTSASGGDSVASSRQSRSVATAPVPAPAAITTAPAIPPPASAIPTAPGIAIPISTAQNTTSTDVPLRRVPATPPRVSSPAPSHVSSTRPAAPLCPTRPAAPESTASLQGKDFSEALHRVQSAVQEASSPPSSLQRRHNIPPTPPAHTTDTSSKTQSRSDLTASALATAVQPEPFMARLDRAAQSPNTQKQPATDTNVSAVWAPLQTDRVNSTESFSFRNGNVGNNGSVVSTGQRRNTTASVSVEESPQLQLEGEASYTALRQAVQPVTARDLEEALDLLRYDVHKEVQAVIREQVRQFSISKDDTAELLKELNAQMAELLRANQELRAENERLRRIY